MRRFFLYRKEDPTGMSSVGRVADGIEFDNGFVAMTWKKEYPSVTFFQSISTVEKLHSHNGKDPTQVVWIDSSNEDVVEKASKLKTAILEELQKEAEDEAVATIKEVVEFVESEIKTVVEKDTKITSDVTTLLDSKPLDG